MINSTNDKQRSKELLSAKEKGVSFKRLLKRSTPLFIIRLSLIGLCFYLVMINSPMTQYALVGAGVLLGGLAQDLGWFWRVSEAWNYIEKIADWDKVRSLAGKPVESDSSAKK